MQCSIRLIITPTCQFFCMLRLHWYRSETRAILFYVGNPFSWRIPFRFTWQFNCWSLETFFIFILLSSVKLLKISNFQNNNCSITILVTSIHFTIIFLSDCFANCRKLAKLLRNYWFVIDGTEIRFKSLNVLMLYSSSTAVLAAVVCLYNCFFSLFIERYSIQDYIQTDSESGVHSEPVGYRNKPVLDIPIDSVSDVYTHRWILSVWQEEKIGYGNTNWTVEIVYIYVRYLYLNVHICWVCTPITHTIYFWFNFFFWWF